MIKKLALLIILISLSNQISYAKDVNFPDLEKSVEQVNIVVNHYKLMSTYADHTFKGNNGIDRYTYSNILYKTIDLLNKKMEEIDQDEILDISDLSNVKQFENISDLSKDNVSYKKIIALLKTGLIRTYSDNTFKGEKTVDHIGFAIGMGRLMSVIYDDAPPILKKKWKSEILRQSISIKEVPIDSPAYKPLMLALENNLLDIKSINLLSKPITRYEVADSTYRLINKLDELRKYLVFTRI
ncbi:MAG: S-layer homology domain-containing protein [Candidatus Sericytochromatia bacterium]|nr:S-layer homology domain-containing protein [Candidatus Sericytochromatia bacterium]